ncbi:hypothetical protein [Streptomyces sp. S465]|uniref:hypothetical protein n=1 Tax=Streptomyces sp. S465 TaxID=2979468 RepID=UPI0022A8340E|nr:hypothetical protein [Streptomyces sp. S465]WAP60121.1 hypothetical protein N6H00_37050 [Streptomyces sp. S465]
MSARRVVIVVWAGLCLAGVAATAALDAEPYPDPGSATEEPTPARPRTAGCQEIADRIEQARAEAEHERQEALSPSAPPRHQNRLEATAIVVPKECADELEERGLTSR